MNSFGIFLTLTVFYIFSKIYERKRAFYLNPVLLSIVTIALILKGIKVEYSSYMESAQILSFLLGPAVVSLAISLYKPLSQSGSRRTSA